MQTQKLESTDAFVVFDLEAAERSVGVVRLAPKILVDGATMLARSVTYQFALLQQQVGGASAGINAKPDARADALAAFATELAPLVGKGALGLDPGKGVGADDLAPLAAVDTRSRLSVEHAPELTAAGVVAAADAALGGLDGRTVALEGLDVVGQEALAVVAALAARGARVVCIATSTGSAQSTDGFDPGSLASGFAEHGAGVVAELTGAGEVGKAWAAVGADVDLLLVGSKAGVVTHDNASHVKAKAVVPIGRVPVTAKALAMLRRAGTVVIPDFVALAGPGMTMWPTGDPPALDAAITEVEAWVTGVLGPLLAHDDGPLLAACYQAETFLRTWREQLPFGRPLA